MRTNRERLSRAGYFTPTDQHGRFAGTPYRFDRFSSDGVARVARLYANCGTIQGARYSRLRSWFAAALFSPVNFSVAASNTRRRRFFIDSNDLRRTFEKADRGTTGSTNPDPLALATLINPAAAKRYVPLYVHVGLQGGSTRSLLMHGDHIYSGQPAPPPDARMCIAASNEEFKRMGVDLPGRP